MTIEIGACDEASRSKAVRDGSYGYFLSCFAGAKVRKGAEFHATQCLEISLVETIYSYGDCVQYPNCGTEEFGVV
jgi:hypothetical protein